MSSKDKLVERFISQPKDFTFDELVTLMRFLGFTKNNKGKTSGSRVRFENYAKRCFVDMHKPHRHGEPIGEIALKRIYQYLSDNKLI